MHDMRKRFLARRNWQKRITIKRIGITLGSLALLITLLGHIYQSGTFNLSELVIELWANLGTELLSIAITILIIDELYQIRDAQREKESLILKCTPMSRQ